MTKVHLYFFKSYHLGRIQVNYKLLVGIKVISIFIIILKFSKRLRKNNMTDSNKNTELQDGNGTALRWML